MSVKVDPTISLGTILHAAVLVVSIVFAYATMSSKLNAITDQLVEVKSQANRVEHYLQKDPDYWHQVNRNGDAEAKH
jgi:hypothetical protein